MFSLHIIPAKVIITDTTSSVTETYIDKENLTSEQRKHDDILNNLFPSTFSTLSTLDENKKYGAQFSAILAVTVFSISGEE